MESKQVVVWTDVRRRCKVWQSDAPGSGGGSGWVYSHYMSYRIHAVKSCAREDRRASRQLSVYLPFGCDSVVVLAADE